MGYIKLNGRSFDADVAISKYNRNFNVLDGDNVGRAMTGRMQPTRFSSLTSMRRAMRMRSSESTEQPARLR